MVAGRQAARPTVGRYHARVNVRRRPFALLLQLAFVATLLMALAPLVSRWQQAHADAPVMVMPSGMVHAMPPAAASPGHAHHAMPMADTSRHDLHTHAPSASPPMDEHAGHGEACEYCLMASRLMPWLVVLILLLPALPVIAPPVLRAVTTPRSLRWPAHGARGPPLNA